MRSFTVQSLPDGRFMLFWLDERGTVIDRTGPITEEELRGMASSLSIKGFQDVARVLSVVASNLPVKVGRDSWLAFKRRSSGRPRGKRGKLKLSY